MRRLYRPFQQVPSWLLLPLALLLVAGIGYMDYTTGDYSMLIFYAIPVTVTAWALGDLGAIAVSVAAGFARYYSDYYSYSNTNLRYWNTAEDFLFLLILGLLTSNIRRILDEEKNEDQPKP